MHPTSSSTFVRGPLLALVLASSALGCAADPSGDSSDPATASRDEGAAAAEDVPRGDLQLDVEGPSRVAGRFSRDGVVLAFDFARTGDEHVAELKTGDGRALVTSKLAGGVETTRIYGGRLVMSGAPEAAEPTFDGDRAELAAVMVEPAMTLLSDLRKVLTARGVDRELHTPARTGALAPAKYFSGWDGYWHLAPGEQHTFGTWAFWYPTYVNLRNWASRCTNVTLWHMGAPEPLVLPGYSWTQATRYYWGFPVTVEPMRAWVDWGSGRICGPVNEIGVITY